MAWEIPGFSWSRVAKDVDDVGPSTVGCGLNVERDTGLLVLPSNGGRIIGVQRNKPAAEEANADDQVTISLVTDGVAVVRIGDTGLDAGDNVTVDDDGTFIQASSGDIVHGVALETGSAGAFGTVLLFLNSALTGS